MAKYEAIITMQNGDIVHYGVVGMKWGQHRYAKANGVSSDGYQYKSYGQRFSEHRLKKSIEKDKKMGLSSPSEKTKKRQNIVDYKKRRDAGMQKYGEGFGLGGAIARSALLGSEYSKARAAGASRGASAAAGLLNRAGYAVGGAIGGAVAGGATGYRYYKNHEKYNNPYYEKRIGKVRKKKKY